MGYAVAIANDVVAFDRHWIELNAHDELPSCVWDYDGGFQVGGEAGASRRLIARAIRSQKGLSRKGRATVVFERQTRPCIALPIKFRRKQYGTIVFLRESASHFSTCDLRALSEVAALMGQAVFERCRQSSKPSRGEAFETFRRLDLFFQDGRTQILDSRTSQDVLQRYLEKVEGVCHPELDDGHEGVRNKVRVSAKLTTTNSQALYLASLRDQGLLAPCPSIRYALRNGSQPQSIAARVYGSGHTIVSNRYKRDCPKVFRVFRDTTSHISAPIVAGDQTTLGVLSIEATSDFAYTKVQASAMTLIAVHAARPLRNAMERELSARRLSDISTLRNAMNSLQDAETWHQIQIIVAEWLAKLGYHRGLFCRVDNDGRKIVGDYSWGERMDDLSRKTVRDFRLDDNDCQVRAVKTREPQLIEDPANDRAAHPDALDVAAVGPFVVVPFVEAGKRINWTIHVERDDVAPIAAPEVHDLVELSRAVITAKVRIEQHAAVNSELAFDRLSLNWTSTLQKRHLRPFDLFANLADLLAENLPVERCFVMLRRKDAWKGLVSSGSPLPSGALVSDIVFPVCRNGTVKKLIEENRAILVHFQKGKIAHAFKLDGAVYSHPPFQGCEALGLHQGDRWLEAPIIMRGKLLAVIVAVAKSSGADGATTQFTNEQLRFVTDVTRCVSLTCDRLFVEDILSQENLLAASMAVYRHEVINILSALRSFAVGFAALDKSNSERLTREVAKLVDLLQDNIGQVDALNEFFSSSIASHTSGAVGHRSIHEEVEQAKRLLPFSDHAIRADLANCRFQIPNSRRSLCLILLQLLQNAVRHGGHVGAISITYHHDSKAQTHVLSLMDNGKGFSAKTHAQLIGKYPFRVPRGKRRSSASTGLGLVYAHLIAEQERWELRLAKRKDPTTWELRIPESSLIAQEEVWD